MVWHVPAVSKEHATNTFYSGQFNKTCTTVAIVIRLQKNGYTCKLHFYKVYSIDPCLVLLFCNLVFQGLPQPVIP